MPEELQAVLVANDGQAPVSQETPTSETPIAEQKPTEPEVVAPATAPVNELVELPDGRKVNAQQAVDEYKNLYSDYTRKSQELATYKGGNKEITKQPENTPAETAEWVPNSWDEVLERAKTEVLNNINSKAQAEQEHTQHVLTQIETEIAAVKALDPNVNETALFTHASRYGFTDLTKAHSNMKDMHSTIEKVREETAKNIQKRQAEPISGTPNAGTVVDSDVYTPSHNVSAVDFLRSLKQ